MTKLSQTVLAAVTVGDQIDLGPNPRYPLWVTVTNLQDDTILVGNSLLSCVIAPNQIHNIRFPELEGMN